MEKFQPLQLWTYRFPHGWIQNTVPHATYFFCPGLRTDVTAWVKVCSHSLSYNVWKKRKQELHFYWPVKVPFYIIHVDLWAPGTDISDKSTDRNLLNAMCDLTHFSSLLLLRNHMQNILQKFHWGCCYLDWNGCNSSHKLRQLVK